ENLPLRSNARTREPVNGGYVEHRASPRLDCQYLVTAWNPGSVTPPTVEPTTHEHQLLYAVIAVLMRHRPLVPAEGYGSGILIPSGGTLGALPAPLRGAELPLEVALPDGLQNLGDFWNTMDIGWKPVVQLTVTIPVILLEPDIESRMVTTVSADYRAG